MFCGPCRFSFERIVAWLHCKVDNALEVLKATCPSALPTGQDAEKSYAAGIVCEYLSAAWAAHLSKDLGLQDVPIVPGKRVLSEMQGPVVSHTPSQDQKVLPPEPSAGRQIVNSPREHTSRSADALGPVHLDMPS